MEFFEREAFLEVHNDTKEKMVHLCGGTVAIGRGCVILNGRKETLRLKTGFERRRFMKQVGLFLVALMAVMFAGCALDVGRMSHLGREAPFHVYDDELWGNIEVMPSDRREKAGRTGVTLRYADFLDAIEISLAEQGLAFRGGRYRLSVVQIDLEGPWAGFDMTVGSWVHYRLFDAKRNEVLLEQRVHASHTATFGDSIWGWRRASLAVEGALKNNIKELLSLLTGLSESESPSPGPDELESKEKD